MIYLGADHRGYELKEKIKKWLKDKRYEFVDLGNEKLDTEDDYPDFALKVAKKIGKRPASAKASASGSTKSARQSDMGIVICGSGVGADIVANRLANVRCGLGFSPQQVRIAKRDDDINCLSLAADFVSDDEAKKIIEMFLETQFSGSEEYLRRINKIEKIK